MQIRLYRAGDELGIWTVFRLAFAGPPWFESYTLEQVRSLWAEHKVNPGFCCLVADDGGRIIGATWWDSPSFEQLSQERGKELVEFAVQYKPRTLVWIRETVVDPACQGQDIGTSMKTEGLRLMNQLALPVLVLTRLRCDNHAIQAINAALGFNRTGLIVDSQSFPGIHHEYWCRFLGAEIEERRTA